jgi:hypothetical protein
MTVIPGRVEDANPESILPIVVMDSGFSPAGWPGNDGKDQTERRSARPLASVALSNSFFSYAMSFFASFSA